MNPLAAHELPFDDVSTVCCQGCTSYDGSLRYSAHPAVVSVVVSASESARVGVWCARCRGIEATKATAISLVAGWWSLRGPKATVAAVRSNLKGGEQHPGTNAEMLRQIARHEYDNGNLNFAAVFAGAAHTVQPQRENGRLLHELTKGGYRSAIPRSPWRFAPFGPIVVLALILGGFGLRAMTGGAIETASVAPVRRAALVSSAPVSKSRTAQWYSPNASADELEKQLTPGSDRRLASAYFVKRLSEIKSDIPSRVRRGDDLWSVETSIRAIENQPAMAQLLTNPVLRNAYDNLNAVMSESVRYYRGGASVEAIERTGGESLNVTVDMALASIDADMRGHTDRGDALASEVDRRAQSLAEMKHDLRIRGAVIALTTRAIDTCLQASR
jgi:hypothetical protein